MGETLNKIALTTVAVTALLLAGCTLPATNSAAQPKKTDTTSSSATLVTPEPYTSPTTADTGAATIGLNEFGITDAEYDAIEKSFVIDAKEHTEPKAVVAAFIARTEQYYMGGLTKENRDRHFSDTTPSGRVGWNAWVNELYTKAFEEAIFAPGYRSMRGGDIIEKYASNKVIIASLWANSIKGNDTPYNVEMSFDIEDVTVTGNSFVAAGTENIQDNSAQVPSVATDSRKIESHSSGSKITFAKDAALNRWYVTNKTGS